MPVQVRTLGEMRDVLADKCFAKKAEMKRNMYYMYRGVAQEGSLRYDITAIPPGKLGYEFAKTSGHYHPVAKGDLSFCEVYGVLSGNAHYLLQKKEKGEIKEVALVKAKAGEVVIVPPNFGHVTINPCGKLLVMANIVEKNFESDYSEYKKMKGAAYFEKTDGKLVENEKYVKVPKIGIFDADSFGERFEAYGKLKGKNLLEIMKNEGKLVEFLLEPNLLK
ncbi:hypothetical protein AUJ17_00060 [Candidatus Micrarchaeota archaeon CG1_02_47_40]|nr:MAG: hypothetical protein AUJ17_00060 [Candidatus Micrarchaeota archaeon CG1_02_47_40]